MDFDEFLELINNLNISLSGREKLLIISAHCLGYKKGFDDASEDDKTDE